MVRWMKVLAIGMFRFVDNDVSQCQLCHHIQCNYFMEARGLEKILVMNLIVALKKL